MNSKKVNGAFLISIILYTAFAFGAVYVIPQLLGSLIVNNLFCEMLVVLPGILFAFFAEGKAPGKNLSAFLHMKKIKVSTLFVIVPFTFFSMPVITLANLISQFFVENEVAAVMESYQIGSMQLLPLVFSVGIFAPFCEELVCRGVYYRGYAKSGNTFRAMLLSSLLFALVHMNINQAIYAFVMGIIAVLLVEATGSLWASVIYHGLINSSQILLMYSMLAVNPSAYSEAAAAMDTDMLVLALAVYLVIVALCLPVAWALLVWMSGNEGRRGVLLRLWKDRKNTGERLITVSLISAALLCIFVMALPWLLQFLS